MEIRALTSSDCSEVVALWHTADLTRPWNPPEQDYRRALDGPTSTVLGAIEAGRIVASVMVGHDGHRGWIYYLAVDPQRRGEGLGRLVTVAAEQWLQRHDVVKVQLMVRHDNARAGGFYEHLGYVDAGVTVLARWLTAPPEADESPNTD